MKPTPRTHQLYLADAGAATAAGGLAESVESVHPDAQSIGVTVLDDAFDVAGSPVAGIVAHSLAGSVGLSAAGRVQALMQAALSDLCGSADLGASALAAEHVFIVEAESLATQPEVGPALLQAWVDACGARSADERAAALRRVTVHDHIGAALAAASGHVAAGAAHALVMCVESWIGRGAWQALDAMDQLRGTHSAGVVAGEAAVILRLASSADSTTTLYYACGDEPQARTPDAPALGSLSSESILAVLGLPAFAGAAPRCMLLDGHANHPAMALEEKFIRRRNAGHLQPTAPGSWLDSGVFGYVGHCGPLLQLALLARLRGTQLPVVATSRSLWSATFVGARPAPVAAAVQGTSRP